MSVPNVRCELLSLKQVALKSGMSYEFVRREVSAGRFPGAFKISNKVKIPSAAADAWIDSFRQSSISATTEKPGRRTSRRGGDGATIERLRELEESAG